jgi:hypothetical protein
LTYLFLAARLLTGGVFAVSLASKLRGRAAFRAFVASLGGLPVPGRRASRGTAVVITIAEAAITGLIVVPVTARLGLLLAAATLATFAAGIQLAVSRGVRAPCRCFGASDIPLGRGHIIRNVLLTLIAAAGAAAGAAAAPLRPAGLALSVAVAEVAILPVLFFDDLVAVIAGPAAPARYPAASQPAATPPARAGR